MASRNSSFSLNEQEWKFIEEYNLSPTSLIKNKIAEMVGFQKMIMSDKVKQLEETILKLNARLEQLGAENESLKVAHGAV